MPNEQKEAQPRPASSSDIAPELEALVAELERGTRAGTQPRPHELIQAIRTLGFDIVPRQPVSGGGLGGLADAVANGEELLATGEALLAFEALGAALERWPDALRLLQLRGLALARSGATWRANQALLELRDAGHRDGETLGLLARTFKDLAICETSPEKQRELFERALQAYQDGYEGALSAANVDDALFTGVNAATVSLLSSQPERAMDLARDVRELGLEQLARDGDAASYWLHATLGETALLLGRREEAERHLRLAAERAAGRYANLSSTRAQARRVLESRSEELGWLDEILQIPPVVVFSGHMIDHPDRKTPRFPATSQAAVEAGVRQLLEQLGPSAAYASAACGGDIIFLEAARERGCEYHVVLPFPAETFATTSVDFADRSGGRAWRDRFFDILDGAVSVTTTSDHLAAGSRSTFTYANLVLDGMAALHAVQIDTEVVGVAVWNGESGDGPGGTASVVEHWRSRGRKVQCIDPARPTEGRRLDARVPDVEPSAGLEEGPQDTPHRLRAMLFADAVGYSKLSEDQIPLFVEHFLSPVARLIEESEGAPILKETAGDGFYFVFRSVRDAGIFGLALCDLITDIDWEARKLPESMGLRVALHCGPVHSMKDPITGQQKYTGPHTSRTACIEPITPAGQVYASQAFAALAAASGVADFSFEYVGRTALAKKYGSLGLYHVRRARVL